MLVILVSKIPENVQESTRCILIIVGSLFFRVLPQRCVSYTWKKIGLFESNSSLLQATSSIYLKHLRTPNSSISFSASTLQWFPSEQDRVYKTNRSNEMQKKSQWLLFVKTSTSFDIFSQFLLSRTAGKPMKSSLDLTKLFSLILHDFVVSKK